MTSWPLSLINTLIVLLAGTERLMAYSFKRIKDNLSTEPDSSYSLMIVVIIAKRFPALTDKKKQDCVLIRKNVNFCGKQTIFNIFPAVNLV